MISVYKIKPKFQKLLQPILVFLRKIGVSPNQITIFTVFFSIALGVFLFFAIENKLWFLFVSLGLLLRMALNALDGMMAKQFNLQSKKGEILNELGDVISDLAIFFPFIYFDSLKTEYVIIFIVFSIINEFCGILSKSIYGERRYDGPMGKSDRALLIGLICIVFYFTDTIFTYLDHIFLLGSFLMIISSYFRLTKSNRNE
jgi:CDP-diacylglycerol--glycerol-3-phosphate 3-phosphatidyltransferase